MLTEEKSDIADRLSVSARSWARPDALEHRDPVTEAALMFDALNELNFRRKRIAELEAQVSEIHASGLRLTFDHEWYVSGVRRDPGNYVLMRIGPAKDAETPF